MTDASITGTAEKKNDSGGSERSASVTFAVAGGVGADPEKGSRSLRRPISRELRAGSAGGSAAERSRCVPPERDTRPPIKLRKLMVAGGGRRRTRGPEYDAARCSNSRPHSALPSSSFLSKYRAGDRIITLV